MGWGDILADAVRAAHDGAPVSEAQYASLRTMGDRMQAEIGIDVRDEQVAEFDGDLTAHGGDINTNVIGADATTDPDPTFALQRNSSNLASVWYDQSSSTLVIQTSGGGSPVAIYDGVQTTVQFGTINSSGSSGGYIQLQPTSNTPTYVSSATILWVMSTGTAYQLRARSMKGSSQSDVLIATVQA